jgi:O-antigen/teichoic acid export membrane protein
MAYFEIFYAWARVYMRSLVILLKVALRSFIITLIGVYFKWITVIEFVYVTAGIYFLAFIVTMLYALSQKKNFNFQFPIMPEIMVYTFFIILSGSVATLLLDIDKIMLNQYIKIENIAYYSVATYIALVISNRAMHQIVYPITAKLMHDNKHDELNDLYKKTSINTSRGRFCDVVYFCYSQLYEMVPKEYGGGILVVYIGIIKIF